MNTNVLTPAEVDDFWENGYALIPGGLTRIQLEALRSDFAHWVEESRAHAEPHGETQDGRARFDLETGHSRDRPALRRVASPIDVSDAYLAAMRDKRALDAVAQLIGPNAEVPSGASFFSQQAKAAGAPA